MLFSIWNKILEKLVYKRSHQYLEKKEILYYKQFGLHTTTCVLLSIVDKISEAIDYDDYCMLVVYSYVKLVVDLRKAFDTINHDILV